MSFEARDPHLERHEVEQMWARVNGALSTPPPPPQRRVLPLALGVGALALAAASFVLLFPTGPVTVVAEGEDKVAALPTGGEARLVAGTRLELRESAEGARFVVRGRATFDIPRRRNRKPIVVELGSLEVRVIGTRFDVVSADRGEASVAVERGVVEVWRGGARVARLEAGERYPPLPPPPPEPSPTPEPVPEPKPESTPRPRPKADVSSATRDALAKAQPDDFFVIANQARAEGEFREAASVYRRFLQQHRDDPRAGIAALELGRLQMDRLRQPKRARRSLERAKRLGVGPVEVDLSYRLIRLYETLGDTEACRREKKQHLSRFPESVHRPRVEQGCAGD